ncbi:MAG: YciI family protein [Bacteroidota bacterium]|nr:YciI family protein [Bacteroidota bacterium]MDE2645998.1 YciI family protein [Bacteroidota bacterium]
MTSIELLTSMGAYNQALIEAGITRDGAGLRPTRDGVRVRFDGDSRTISRGSFNLTSGLVSWYWIWEVEDMDQAIAWIKRCPNPHLEAGEVEIRPLYEPEDFIE